MEESFHHRATENTERDGVTGKIIGAAIEVHRSLGPGLLESTYVECLARELMLRDVAFRREVSLASNIRDYDSIVLIDSISLLLIPWSSRSSP
jgi:GxxExxY protein